MTEQDELIGVFVEESVEHLESIEPDLLRLEQDPENVDSDIVNSIFRAVHSVKGAAGFFGFNKIGNLAHLMENLLSRLRDGKITATAEFTDALFSGLDTLRAMFDDVGSSEQFDVQQELDRLSALLNHPDGPENIVTVKEKPETGRQAREFDIQESELSRFVEKGQFLYTISIHLKTDLTDKGKTPLDLIKSITSTGELIESRLDIDNIRGMEDCLENELTFVFAFATILEQDLLPAALEIPEERISVIDTSDHEPGKEGGESVQDLVSRKLAEKKETSDAGQKSPVNGGESVSAPRGGKKEAAESAPAEKSPQGNPQPSDVSKTDNGGVQKSGPEPKNTQTVHAEEKVRVGINLLNDLVNLAGEMVLGRNQLNQISMPLVKDAPGLNAVTTHISRITTEMQEKIMQMRMQPVSTIFGKFQRVVRDLSKKMNKEITLVTYGEDVELDKSIIEALSDPLTHLIRNSVDHGIESAEEREKLGKPRQGTLELKAYHQAGHVYIDIADDGGGIDGPAVGEKAVEKGLITKDQLKEMGDKELAKLIFKPGFSTAKEVSDVSGRGVGMDVVMTNIHELGGTVDIDTELHRGTTISLVLPLTLAIVSGLVIFGSGRRFILPEANIDELVRIKSDEMKKKINVVQNSHVLRLRDILLPLISLKKVLGLDRDTENGGEFEDRTEPLRILVIKHGSSRFGLLVDSVENIEEIVVKPLPRYLSKQKCFSGASIMGNGSISMILDVAGVFEKARLHHVETKIQDKQRVTETRSAEKDIQTLLLFDNKTSEQFALPLELITRIEKVKHSEIEKVKDQHYLQYQGDKLRLVFLEDYLPVEKPDRSGEDTLGIIVPKLIKHPMGIVIGSVKETVHTEVEIDTHSITSPGLFGSAILEGRITLLPDMYRLFELAAPEWYQGANGAKKESVSKKRILIVEDTPFFRMIEKDYLISAGYEVLEAENGKQALDILGRETVDGVILDIIMPEMDGWETIRAIRSDPGLKEIPVMAVTSLAEDAESEKRSRQEGFDRWEAKLNKERLLEKLSDMLTREKEKI
ncbi:MAG: chemotaxis protein CheW [Desulfobacteraceae bacterium]